MGSFVGCLIVSSSDGTRRKMFNYDWARWNHSKANGFPIVKLLCYKSTNHLALIAAKKKIPKCLWKRYSCWVSGLCKSFVTRWVCLQVGQRFSQFWSLFPRTKSRGEQEILGDMIHHLQCFPELIAFCSLPFRSKVLSVLVGPWRILGISKASRSKCWIKQCKDAKR